MRRIAVAVVCARGLSACEGFDLGGQAAPVQRAALLGGAVDVAGPEGYCVDVADSRLGRGFALLVPCANLGLAGTRAVPQPAFITVQAGRVGTAAVTGSEPAFAGLLETANGAALLSPSGSSETVDVIGTTSSANKVIVHFENLDGTPVPGTQTEEWRAFVDINGRLVTISARGTETSPMGRETGTQFLDAVVAAIMAANAA